MRREDELIAWVAGHVDDLGLVAADVKVAVCFVDVAAGFAAPRLFVCRNLQLDRHRSLLPVRLSIL